MEAGYNPNGSPKPNDAYIIETVYQGVPLTVEGKFHPINKV
jgi:hypothetical protein